MRKKTRMGPAMSTSGHQMADSPRYAGTQPRASGNVSLCLPGLTSLLLPQLSSVYTTGSWSLEKCVKLHTEWLNSARCSSWGHISKISPTLKRLSASRVLHPLQFMCPGWTPSLPYETCCPGEAQSMGGKNIPELRIKGSAFLAWMQSCKHCYPGI